MAPATTKQAIALCKTYFNHTLQFAEYQLHLIFDYSSRLHKPLEGHALYRICLLDIGGIRLQVSVILALYLRHTYRTCSCLRSWILIRLSHKKRTPNLKCVLLIWGPILHIYRIYPVLVQLRTCRNMIVNHKKVKLLLALFLMDS